MNRTFKTIKIAALSALAALSLVSCSEDKLGPTIFPDVPDVVDENAYTYKFDKWLRANYLDKYNLEFQYKMEDVGTNMNYNLVPATLANSIDLAVLTKYLWFDAYAEVTGSEEFVKQYGPRILMLIGSPAYNPSSGTMILGLAEGGIKVSLFRVNSMQLDDFDQLNEFYFKTMHHEFAHILHQTKSIPREFQIISTGHYDAQNWQDRDEGVVNSLGFATPYGSSEIREDFAEIIANYITKTDEQWAKIMEYAGRGWEAEGTGRNTVYYCFYYFPNNNPENASGESSLTHVLESSVEKLEDGTYVLKGQYQTGIAPFTTKDGVRTDSNGARCDAQGYVLDSSGKRVPIKVYPVEDADGVDGVAVLNQKVGIARTWFQEQWNIDLDKLREVVQYRQLHYDINELRKPVLE